MSNSFFAEFVEYEDRFDSLQPELSLTVRDSDLGVEGYVVVWNTLASRGGPLAGIGKGGTRITSTVSLDEVARLAQTMTLKNAAAGLPLGGAKSGLRADPSAPEFEKTYRRFVKLCAPALRINGGPYGGFGFDLGGNPIQAVWACDELGTNECITGKSLELGGTDYDREGIAGLGVAVAAQTLLKERNCDLANTTFSVQGLGAMGAAVLRYMREMGAQPRFVSDLRIGGTWDLSECPDEVLDKLQSGQPSDALEDLKQIANQTGDVNDSLFAKVDVVFPAAIQDVITADNSDRINAKFVVEAANFPTTAEALSSLHNRGVFVVPDIIANPGGIISAYVELTSTVSPADNVRERINPERAKQLTREKIAENVVTLLAICAEHDVEPHHAAKYMALRNIFK